MVCFAFARESDSLADYPKCHIKPSIHIALKKTPKTVNQGCCTEKRLRLEIIPTASSSPALLLSVPSLWPEMVQLTLNDSPSPLGQRKPRTDGRSRRCFMHGAVTLEIPVQPCSLSVLLTQPQRSSLSLHLKWEAGGKTLASPYLMNACSALSPAQAPSPSQSNVLSGSSIPPSTSPPSLK